MRRVRNRKRHNRDRINHARMTKWAEVLRTMQEASLDLALSFSEVGEAARAVHLSFHSLSNVWERGTRTGRIGGEPKADDYNFTEILGCNEGRLFVKPLAPFELSEEDLKMPMTTAMDRAIENHGNMMREGRTFLGIKEDKDAIKLAYSAPAANYLVQARAAEEMFHNHHAQLIANGWKPLHGDERTLVSPDGLSIIEVG